MLKHSVDGTPKRDNSGSFVGGGTGRGGIVENIL